MSNSSFKAAAQLLSVTSASQMAQALGMHWPPPPQVSLGKLVTLATLSAPVPTSLLIIAPAALISDGKLPDLIAHKNQTGMPSTIVALEEVISACQGEDDPARIKGAIYLAYVKRGVQYVMLVGDAQRFPVRFRFVKDAPGAAITASSGWLDGTYAPTDLYYAALVDDYGIYDTWDGDGDGKYNESTWNSSPWSDNPDGVTGKPTLALGRVPANTAADVAAYVAKVIQYEVNQTGIPDMITFVADNAYDTAASLSSTVAQSSGITNVLASRSLAMTDGSSPTPSGWTAATATDISNAAGDSFWLSYIGHGGGTVWGTNSVYTTTEVGALANGYLPIVFAAACSTGGVTGTPPVGEYFDTQGTEHWFWFGTPYPANTVVDPNPTPTRTWDFSVPGTPRIEIPTPSPWDFESGAARIFAYAWLFNSSGGAIVYFGENIVMEDDAGTELESYVLWEYARGNRVLGSIWLNAQRAYWNEYILGPFNLDPNFAHPRIFLGIMMMYGDPSLRLR